MDLCKVHVNATDFRDSQQGLHSRHLFAEVALIEKRPNGAKPLLYQLKKDCFCPLEDAEILRQEFIQLPHPAFLEVGYVIEVNMNKKTILLDDSLLVTYKFLLVVTSIDHYEETSVALHTLKEALLLDVANAKNKILQEHQTAPKLGVPPHNFSVPEPSISKNYKYIEDLVQQKMNDNTSPSEGFEPSIKKLCFLQT